MKKGVGKTVLLCAAFMAIVLGLTFNRILMPAPLTNEQLSENGLFIYDVPRRFSDFSLLNYDNEIVNKEILEGKWSLIFFGYTFCPDICPLTMSTLKQFSQILEAVEDYNDDTQVIMVSVDPQRDTPDRLKDYVTFFNKDNLALTGEYIDIFNLSSQLNIAFGYLPGEGENYLVTHSGEIALINPNGHFHGFFKVPHDPEKMASNFEQVRARWN